MDESSSQSWLEKEGVPRGPKSASLPTDSSYLASEAARTNPNRTPPPCITTPCTADTDNGAVSDSDVGCQQTPRLLRRVLEAEAFWDDDICVTYMMTVIVETRNKGATVRYTGIVL